jgi:hypothetical protein
MHLKNEDYKSYIKEFNKLEKYHTGDQGCSILSNLWITKDFYPKKGILI